MPTDVIFTGKTDTGVSDLFDCVGYANIEMVIWSEEANPDATLQIERVVTDTAPVFILASPDLSVTNPAIYDIPSTAQVRLEVMTNASGKAVNAKISRSKFEGGP